MTPTRDELEGVARLLRRRGAEVLVRPYARMLEISYDGGQVRLVQTDRGWADRTGLLPARTPVEVAEHMAVSLGLRLPRRFPGATHRP